MLLEQPLDSTEHETALLTVASIRTCTRWGHQCPSVSGALSLSALWMCGLPLCHSGKCWAEARIKITRMTLTIKLDRNWSSFQLAHSAPPLSVTGSALAPSARMPVSARSQRLKMVHSSGCVCYITPMQECQHLSRCKSAVQYNMSLDVPIKLAGST